MEIVLDLILFKRTMEVFNFFLTRDLWTKCLLEVPYLSLGKAAKSCRLFAEVIKSSWFWYLKTYLELKGKIDEKEFVENPRLRYVRLLGLNYILHPGFEVYFSAFEMAMRAAQNKDKDLLDYAIAYILRTRQVSRPDWLAVNLAYLDYTFAGYQLIVAMNLKVATLIPFFLDALNPSGPRITKEMLENLFEVQGRRHGTDLVKRMKEEGELCLKIAQGTQFSFSVEDYPARIFHLTALKYKRYDLIPEGDDLIENLVEREDFSAIEKLVKVGKIDLSKYPNIFRFLYFQDSRLSVFSLVLQHFDGVINSRDDRKRLFTYKCEHDLVGFNLILSKLPMEMIRRNEGYISANCPLARILCQEKLQAEIPKSVLKWKIEQV